MEISHYLDARGRDLYQDWVDALRDMRGKVAILRRVDRIEGGNFGDHRSLREGVSELRLDVGPGYRVYFAMDGEAVVLLLCGGDKDSQDRDIERAITSWFDYLQRNK